MQAGMRMSDAKAQTSRFGRHTADSGSLAKARIAGIQPYYAMQLDIGAGGSEALKFYSFCSV